MSSSPVGSRAVTPPRPFLGIDVVLRIALVVRRRRVWPLLLLLRLLLSLVPLLSHDCNRRHVWCCSKMVFESPRVHPCRSMCRISSPCQANATRWRRRRPHVPPLPLRHLFPPPPPSFLLPRGPVVRRDHPVGRARRFRGSHFPMRPCHRVWRRRMAAGGGRPRWRARRRTPSHGA